MASSSSAIADMLRDIFDVASAVLDDVPGPMAQGFREDLAEMRSNIGVDQPTVPARTCTKVEMGETCEQTENSHISLTHSFTHPDLECQVVRGPNAICGQMEDDPIHWNGVRWPDSHHYMPNALHAGVAQSAEQDFRKVEAVGSTPIPSSTGFNKSERDAMGMIVHYTTKLFEDRKLYADKQVELETHDRDSKAKGLRLVQQIMQHKVDAAYHGAELTKAEDAFRLKMLNSTIVKSPAVVEPEPAQEHEETIDLGRAE